MKTTFCTIALSALLIAASSANAAAIISGTRILFPSDEREVSVRLSNEGKEPGLIQVWLDDGDEKAAPDKISVPFVLTPPMFRMDGGKGQTVRMIFNGAPLPQDRESLFWFNMLEVGPKPVGEAALNYMQMAFRTRIKVFYRPKALNSTQQIEDAMGRLQWRLARNGEGVYTVTLDNPTPYHVSLINVALLSAADVEKKSPPESDAGGMAEPGKSASFLFKDLKVLPAGPLKVRYSYLNDFGGSVQKEAELVVGK